MGKVKLVDLSHPFRDNCLLQPYFEDVKIKRVHYHAKSGVLSQKITTVMHCTTHANSPAYVIEGTEFTDDIPLDKYYGTGVMVDIPKGKWDVITPEDLENARPRIEIGKLRKKSFLYNKNRVDRVCEIIYLRISQGNTVSYTMR